MSLPSLYLENGRYPAFKDLTQRSKYTIPREFTDSHGNSSLSQDQVASLLSTSYDSMTKWMKELILSELKPLFLRIRTLDESKKNYILQDFFALLFPTFAKSNHDKLTSISKDFRKTYNNWRNSLWKKLLDRHKLYVNYKNEVDDIKPNLYIKNQHIHDIFGPWLKFVSGSSLKAENEDALKNLVIFGFFCIDNYPEEAKAHDKFFSFNGSLYTINSDFPSFSGYNIASSMDLSKYDAISSGGTSEEFF